jgi:hypothetical protein
MSDQELEGGMSAAELEGRRRVEALARGMRAVNAMHAEAERKTLKKMARKDPDEFMDRFRKLVDAATPEIRAAMLEYIRSASTASDVKATPKRGRGRAA